MGGPVRGALIALIHVYRRVFAGAFGGQCRFYPSCSHFAQDAIRVHGAIRGAGLASWRILRCNPFGRGGIDRVPERVALHDAVTQPARAIRAESHEMTGA
ncbi:MAG: membrane protein insertion efficiency factor YidD [Actinomycetota bacterium]